MKINPLELIGGVLFLSGLLWSWYKGNATAGIGAVEVGIFCLVVGGLLSGLFKKTK